MMEQKSFDREINAYLLKVDAVLESANLLDKKGTAVLNNIQKEVDMTLDNLRSMQRERRLTRVKAGMVAGESVDRVKVLVQKILFQSKVPLGSMFGSLDSDSVLTNPMWKEAFSRVSLAIDNFTNTYAQAISNMDNAARRKIDNTLATLVENAQIAFARDSSGDSSVRYLQASLKAIKALEAGMDSQVAQSSAASLELSIMEKDQERVSLLSQVKLLEADLTPQQVSVVNDASRRIMEKLDKAAASPSSYDASIFKRSLQLVDSDLEIMRKVIQNARFGNELGGFLNNRTRGFAQRRMRQMRDYTKRLRRRLKPRRTERSLQQAQADAARRAQSQREMNRQGSTLQQAQADAARRAYEQRQGGSGSPFQPALANLSGGLGIAFKKLDNMADVPAEKMLETVQHNASIIKAQGGINKDQRPFFTRQVNSLNKEAFGGDVVAMQEAKKYYTKIAETGLGSMTKAQIRAKHPKGTKQSHIDAMHTYMQDGMEFGPAHDQAVKDGFPAGNLGFIQKYEAPKLSQINLVRLFGTGALLLGTYALISRGLEYRSDKKMEKTLLGDR